MPSATGYAFAAATSTSQESGGGPTMRSAIVHDDVRVTERHDMSGPLTGIRVLDLTRLLPGAYATGLLGDLGAEVIKVEQPGGGDPMRQFPPRLHGTSAFSWITDRNKRSVVLNLRDPRGAEAFLALARSADVVIEGFRPGVVDRLGVGYEAVRAVNPRVVYCSISGYGAGGPLVREAGHDINYLGRAGVLSVSDGLSGVQIAD